MKNFALTTIAVLSLLFTMVSTIYLMLEYYSGPSLYAEVRGYPHNHLMDWKKLDIREARKLGKSSFFDGNITRISGVYDIILMNSGDTVAKGVRIFVPRSIGMMISRNDKKNFMEGDNVTIGDLNPNEEIKLVSWVSWYTSIFRFIEPEIRITYENGSVELDYRYEVSDFFRFLDRNLMKIFFTTWGLFFVLSLVLRILGYRDLIVGFKVASNNDEDEPQS